MSNLLFFSLLNINVCHLKQISIADVLKTRFSSAPGSTQLIFIHKGQTIGKEKKSVRVLLWEPSVPPPPLSSSIHVPLNSRRGSRTSLRVQQQHAAVKCHALGLSAVSADKRRHLSSLCGQIRPPLTADTSHVDEEEDVWTLCSAFRKRDVMQIQQQTVPDFHAGQTARFGRGGDKKFWETSLGIFPKLYAR